MMKAILWDNDGLLLDSEALFFELTRSVFSGLGFELTTEYWGIEYLSRARRTRQLARELGMSPDLVEKAVEMRDRRFFDALQRPIPLRPAVRETLDALSGRFRHAVVTGSPREKVELMHRHSGLEGYFEQVVTCDDVEETKPHPEPYFAAMRKLGLGPGECLAVEDSERGLDSAHAAGVKCVVVPNSLTRMQRFEKAYAVEDDVSGILKHLA
ncbi:haloacid dehalogenase [Prosthecochloris sp. GSB1]|nr:HAD family phosphatase [Prosthecochloris sp. GSB1]ASQ91744.1 haloacid dehalogenase [Prosthecochloris sp. GSB1]